MAAVRIERTALSDARIKMLSTLLEIDVYSALGRMTHVWAHCTDRQSYTVSAELLAVLGDAPDFGCFLEKAELAELEEDGSYRIRGTQGRIEWLGKLRENGKHGDKGGRPKKENPHGLPENNPHGFVGETPLVPVPSPVPTQKKEERRTKGELALADGSIVPADKDPAKAKARTFAAAYVKAYQTRYSGGRPEDLNDGKVRGQILAWIKDYPLERACQLIQVFFQMETKWFSTKGYDFLTFRNNLNKIGQALDTGTDPDGNRVDWSKITLKGGT